MVNRLVLLISVLFLPVLSVVFLLCLPLLVMIAANMYTITAIVYLYELLCRKQPSFSLPWHPCTVWMIHQDLLNRALRKGQRILPSLIHSGNNTNKHAAYRRRTHNYGAQNRLDLYYPSDRTLRTMVVFLYDTGDALLPNRVFYTAFAERLCDLGYIVAVPDYRSYDDVRDVLKWAHQHACDYADPEMIYILGHGQGAYIATQVVLTDILEKAQLSTSCSSDHKHDPATQSDFLPQIEGLLLLAGVYSDRSEVDALVKRPSPMQLVCDHSLLFTTSHDLIDFFPRLLFIHGEQDHIVPAETSVQMYNLLGQILPTEDVDVRMRIYKKLGHSIHENARLISRDVRQFIEE